MSDEANILIVEDSPTQAERLRYLLEEHGYRVSVARNGKEALAAVKASRPALILCDVLMPEMDGFQFCRTLKQDEELQEIPVALVTALSDPADIIKGLQCDAHHFIVKPYEDDDLLSRVRFILANQELRKSSGVELSLWFAGRKYHITSERMQILNLLFSSFDAVIQKNRDLERLNKDLRDALETVKVLKGLLPICAHCKKVRDDQGYWTQVEDYVRDRSEAEFSHGICPECLTKHYPAQAGRRGRADGE